MDRLTETAHDESRSSRDPGRPERSAVKEPAPVTFKTLPQEFERVMTAISDYGTEPTNVTLRAAVNTVRRLRAGLQPEINRLGIEPQEPVLGPALADAIQSQDPEEITFELHLEQSSIRGLATRELDDTDENVPEAIGMESAAHRAATIELALVEVGRTMHNLNFSPSGLGGDEIG